MNYTVTFRDRTGALKKETIQAASRRDVQSECRARKIVPVSIVAGGNGVIRKNISGMRLRLVAAGVAVAIAGIGLWWLLGSRTAAPNPRSPKALTGETYKATDTSLKNSSTSRPGRPAKMGRRSDGNVQSNVSTVADIGIKTNWPYMWRGKVVQSIEKCYTNMGKEVVYFTTEDGRRHCSERIAYKPLFENATDDLISQALNTDPNVAMPPMPAMQGLDKEFLASLGRPIVIGPDDSETVRRIKESVIQARKDMKKMMDGGMTFNEVLLEHRKMANENFDMRRQAAADLKQLVDAGEQEEAQKYLETMNAALEQVGLAPLEMPASHDEIMARRRANRKRLQEEEDARAQGR